jgi:NAD(P)-dependent dehydrogenase (short-subunit alcohol dehydrogenase family)
VTSQRRLVALVTGGGSGVGLEIARALGGVRYAVAIVGRSRERLEAAEQSLRSDVPELFARQGDVREGAAIDALVGDVEDALGPVDVLVHAAGTGAAVGPTWEVEEATWRADVEIGLTGAYLLIRRVVPGMIARERGRVIALNSYAAVRPAPHQSAYAAGKAGLASLVESLDAELEGTGVRAFTVTPGFVRTEMTAAMAETPWFSRLADRHDALPPERVAALVTRIARGEADPLSGRFLHALDDLDDLLAHVSEIERDELYAPRLRRLGPPTET